MTHPPSSRREEQKTEDVQLSKMNVGLIKDGREPSVNLARLKCNIIIGPGYEGKDMNIII